MKAYVTPVVMVNEDAAEGVYAASGVDCMDVTSWIDSPDGSVYRVVFKVTHKGHQSYGQTVVATMSTNVTLVEAPSDVQATVSGNVVTLVRNNQLNADGVVEMWVKLDASVAPTVLEAVASDCVRE